MLGLDHSIFRAVNGLHGLDPVMLFFSNAFNLTWVKVVLVGWVLAMVWVGGKHRVAILTALVGVGISNPLTDIFKHNLPALRPFRDPDVAADVILRIGAKSDQVGFGTASAHSANMAAVAAAVWLGLGWRWGLPWAFVAFLTGVSRIYNGVHYPWQVVLGWTLGVCVSWSITFLWRKLAVRAASEPSPSGGGQGEGEHSQSPLASDPNLQTPTHLPEGEGLRSAPSRSKRKGEGSRSHLASELNLQLETHTPTPFPDEEGLRIAARLALDEAMAKFPLRARPVIEWRPYRVTAGMAYYRANKIGLSKFVLTKPADVRETLLHEYAHLLAVERHGVKAANHGPGWRQAMIDLGLAPRVRHNMPVERNGKRQAVVYKCLKCGAEIVRARKLPKRRKYHHVSCGGAIRLARVDSLTSPTDRT